MPLRHSIGEQGGGDQSRIDAQNAVGLFMWVRMEVGYVVMRNRLLFEECIDCTPLAAVYALASRRRVS